MKRQISQDDIAKLVSETRPNIKKWMERPDLMPIGVYKQLQALGVNLHTQEWDITTCEFCGGKGFRLTQGIDLRTEDSKPSAGHEEAQG